MQTRQSAAHSWFIIAAVMLSTVMEILDTTIVNVSLPHMMGSLSADRDQISWVLTSYIVAAGVLMPLTGFLVNRFGCRRLLLINIIGFMIASALCGISENLFQIVFFRLMQGAFGASLVPLSQFILRESFPPEDQAKVMALWGIGVMAAPIMGPTIGGYITDALSWRWVFYINVPVCLLDFFLVLMFIRETATKKTEVDWLGMVLMVASIGSLQLFLDRGEVSDWFASPSIRWLFGIFVLTFALFLVHSFKSKNSIINLRLFGDRSFAFGTLIMCFFAASVLGSLALFPQMLETLYGYTSNLTGMVMAPRGIASAVMMVVSSRLIMRGFDPRKLIFFGLGIGVYSTWLMSAISLDASMTYILMLGLLQGFGVGFFFMPLTSIVYSNLSRQSVAEATGLFNFGRNIGNAIGISLLTTYLDRDTQANWHMLGRHVQPANPSLTRWLDAQHLSLTDPQTIILLGQQLNTQANFIAFMHTFRITAMLLLVALCMVLLLKPNPIRQRTAPLDAH